LTEVAPYEPDELGLLLLAATESTKKSGKISRFRDMETKKRGL
jgi:hypothetical protein